MDCIFCKIANGEIPSEFVYEDERVCAFNDLNPVAPEHILVVPKAHIVNVEDLNEENIDIMADIFRAIKAVAKKRGFAENGYRVITNNGSDGGQEVMHLHFHVLAGKKLPNYEKDEK